MTAHKFFTKLKTISLKRNFYFIFKKSDKRELPYADIPEITETAFQRCSVKKVVLEIL